MEASHDHLNIAFSTCFVPFLFRLLGFCSVFVACLLICVPCLFHCCVAAWVSTSKHVFCQFGELCDWNIILPPLGPFMLTREYRMILRRKLTSLLKQHIAYRCALCACFVNGSKKDTLIQLQHRISFKSLMYLVIRQQVSEKQCTIFFHFFVIRGWEGHQK